MAEEVLVGTGGWSYFDLPYGDRLNQYSKIFDFVEVNVTFYKHVTYNQALNWKKRVPKDFEFTVKCHRDVTHVNKLSPTNAAIDSLNKCISVCKALNAKLLILEAPPYLDLDVKKAKDMEDLFNSISLNGLTLALEIRGKLSDYALKIMRDHGIVHVVDISKEEPYYENDICYSRIFGSGNHNIYQFDDEELYTINQRANSLRSKRVYLTFHTVRMNIDASRLKYYRLKGEFPRAYGLTGLEAVKQEIMSDVKFPTNKDELIKYQGWKVIDWNDKKRIKLSSILSFLPQKSFITIDDLMDSLKSIYSDRDSL